MASKNRSVPIPIDCTPTRDQRLDMLRGIACVLMVIAHARTLGKTVDTPFSLLMWTISLFAPVLFFFALGWSVAYQQKKKNFFSFASLYVLLFFFSFADIGRASEQYLTFGAINLFGSLALSALVTFVATSFLQKPLLLLFLPIVIDRVLNRVLVAPTILHGQLFSIFPWISFAIFGNLMERRERLVYLLSSVAMTFAIVLIAFKGLRITSQDTTTLYLLVAFGSCAGVLFLISRIQAIRSPLIFLGKNSLLFYWVHLTLLTNLKIHTSAEWVWVLLLLLTVTSMWVLIHVNERLSWLFSSAELWLLLLTLLCVPFAFHWSLVWQSHFFSVILIIFALNYRNAVKALLPLFQRKEFGNV